MKINKKLLFSFLILSIILSFPTLSKAHHVNYHLLLSSVSDSSHKEIKAVRELIKRILPKKSNKFKLELIKKAGGKDVFEITSIGNKVVIRGNSGISMAAGLNWYLKYYCNAIVSWCGNQLNLPDTLPYIDSIIVKKSPYRHNLYFNYCTFGYSMAFWDWDRWEREIDIMALNGVTTPMALVGTEVVWRNTLRQFGYSDREIKDFLPGPCYFPWCWMGNLTGLGGPLPDEWFDKQTVLQKKILKRMREYGMKPVLLCFYGMVPASLQDKFPDARIIPQGKWAKAEKRPPLLMPSDPLFKKMAKIWYDEQEKLFGETEYFGGDLFHEGGNREGIDISLEASKVQEMMLEANLDATWLLQSWFANPRGELLNGLQKENTLIVDLCAEYWDRWRTRKGFNGFLWIWSNISNWGGNIGLHGRLDAIANGPIAGLSDSIASKSMVGIGSTPEGIETNPVVFDLANEMRWHFQSPEMKNWIMDYAVRRYGHNFKETKEAWKIFYKTAYGTYEKNRRPSESVFCARPSLQGEDITASPSGQCNIFYDPDEFSRGVKLLLSKVEELKNLETYQYDVVDMVRQHLSNQGRIFYYNLVGAFEDNDIEDFLFWSEKFLEVMLDQDRLLSTHPQFNLHTRLNQARSYSDNPEVKDLYEYNAILQITTWTENPPIDKLHDYASKEWAGMLKNYYYPRWKMYLKHLERKLRGKRTEKIDFLSWEKQYIKDWKSHFTTTMSSENPIKVAIELFRKYN